MVAELQRRRVRLAMMGLVAIAIVLGAGCRDDGVTIGQEGSPGTGGAAGATNVGGAGAGSGVAGAGIGGAGGGSGAAGAGSGMAGAGGIAGSSATDGGGLDGGAAGAGGANTVDAGLPAPTVFAACRLLGLGHTRSMDLSPDGTLAGFGSAEGGVTLFGLSDFIAQRTITAHPAPVTAVAFSLDSTQIASADANGDVALWNVADGSPVWSASPLDAGVVGLAVAPGGTLWALSPNGLTAINLTTGAHGATASAGMNAATLAITADGQTIALGDTDGGVQLLAAADLSQQASIAAAQPGAVTALRISGNGQKMMTGGADGTTALWDLQGNLLGRFPQPGGPVASVDINADGSLLVAGTAQSNLIYTFKPDGTVTGNYGGFTYFPRLSLDGTHMITMGGEARVDRTSIDTTQPQSTQVWSDDYTSAAFSPDGRYVAQGVYDNIQLWDTQTGEMVRLLDTNPPCVTPATGIAFSPDGATLARNDYNGHLYLLGTADSSLVASYTGTTGSYSVAYSPDGQWVATTGPAHVMLWHVSDGTSGPTGFVGSGGLAPTAVAFSTDGQTLAVGDSAGNVVTWSFPGGAMLAEFAAVPAAVKTVGFSPDGTRLAVTDLDDHPALFELDGNNLPLAGDALPWVSFSYDGAYLATLVAPPRLTQSTALDPEEHDILLSSPGTGAPAANYLWTFDLGSNQSDFSGDARPVFAPHDHRLLINSALGGVLCLP